MDFGAGALIWKAAQRVQEALWHPGATPKPSGSTPLPSWTQHQTTLSSSISSGQSTGSADGWQHDSGRGKGQRSRWTQRQTIFVAREARLCLARASDKTQAVYGASLGRCPNRRTGCGAGDAGRDWINRSPIMDWAMGHMDEGGPISGELWRARFLSVGLLPRQWMRCEPRRLPGGLEPTKQREWTRGKSSGCSATNTARRSAEGLPWQRPEEAPVNAAHRYLTQRHDCLTVMSVHNCQKLIGHWVKSSASTAGVVQKRLKLAGNVTLLERGHTPKQCSTGVAPGPITNGLSTG